MDLFIDIITGLCFFIGSLSIIIGACGLIKLPDVFSSRYDFVDAQGFSVSK